VIEIEQPNLRVIKMLTRLAIENPGTRTRYKMSAGIVHRRDLVSTGVNSYKSHPLMTGPGYNSEQIFMHAEVDAVRNALRLINQNDLSECAIYVVRVKRSRDLKGWQYGMARPCRGCTRMIASFGIDSVWWSEDHEPIAYTA
jgi:deoxycytidylate deaminase